MRYTEIMKKIFVLLLFLFLLISTREVSAQRTAECDACGYCKGRPVPENWSSCAECIYPTPFAINKNPTANETLKINSDPNASNFNKPPIPEAGRYFTQLGCVDTGFDSFRDASAAGGVLNFILNNLMFPIVGTLAFAVIIYAAFLLATAQGDQFKIAQGKRMITSAIVGLLFTFGVVLIVNIIGSDILRIPGFTRSDQIYITARGQYSALADGTRTYPTMEIYLNGELLESYVTKDKGTYTAVLPKGTLLTADIRVRFPNDHCPRCQGNPNGETGDRNLIIEKWQIGDSVCKQFNYFHENTGATVAHTSTVGMYYRGYSYCTSY